ncbi:uncharacterized protein LOC123547047 [Mercenaria mercenaria]|uniref:uncharacterized protein LOC123547047 n=1 Tax=Mercenaria mercenaria TaxID=6596 RepID=UPI00234FB4ED|nr:uncharacterized protein LOC123547047 [Mercenaria mercenaria]
MLIRRLETVETSHVSIMQYAHTTDYFASATVDLWVTRVKMILTSAVMAFHAITEAIVRIRMAAIGVSVWKDGRTMVLDITVEFRLPPTTDFAHRDGWVNCVRTNV